MSDNKRIKCTFIAGGKYHDIDFARLEVLKLLAEDERIRTRVFEDYTNLDAIMDSDFLVTYTCDVVPPLHVQEALRTYVESGKRWYALHGTNSILRFLQDGRVDAPRLAPHFMETLGSQFVAHPPIEPYMVHVVDREHELTKGMQDFETTDEKYLVETYSDNLEVLMDVGFEGEAAGFVEDQWEKKRHPVFYIHRVGEGAVLYLTLGHCRGHYDMYDLNPPLEYYPAVERCAWDLPVFYDLLRRGLDWTKRPALAA